MESEKVRCPICGVLASLLSTGKPQAVRRIDSTCTAGLYDITLQADELLARPGMVTADERAAIEERLNELRSGDDDNPPLLTRDMIRDVTGQPLL